MAHIFNPENKDKLISDERRKVFKPERLLTAAGLKEGMSVFDVGCGNGFFALPAAKIVGDNGRVFGFDIYQEMLDSLNSRAEESDINNIKTLKVSEDGTNLSEINMLKNKEIDFIIMANILHEVPDINYFLKGYLKFLKTGGRLLVIEWRKKETEEGPGLEHRLSPKEVINLMKEQGVKPIYSRVINNNYYLKISEK